MRKYCSTNYSILFHCEISWLKKYSSNYSIYIVQLSTGYGQVTSISIETPLFHGHLTKTAWIWILRGNVAASRICTIRIHCASVFPFHAKVAIEAWGTVASAYPGPRKFGTTSLDSPTGFIEIGRRATILQCTRQAVTSAAQAYFFPQSLC